MKRRVRDFGCFSGPSTSPAASVHPLDCTFSTDSCAWEAVNPAAVSEDEG